MRTPPFIFTAITLCLFMSALYYEGVIFSHDIVSGETLVGEHILVKQGVSQDGSVAIMQVLDAPHIPPRLKIGNHARTLRAFIAPDRGGILSLYIESAVPSAYYAVTGGFTVSPDYPTLAWRDNSTLMFFITVNDGALALMTLDVGTLTSTLHIVDPDNLPVLPVQLGTPTD